MSMKINEVEKEQEVVRGRIYRLGERLSEIKMEIELLDVQMACVLNQRDKAVERIKFLRMQRDKGVRFFRISLYVKFVSFFINWFLKIVYL